MKITFTLISAFLITFAAKAQHLSFIKEPDKISNTFSTNNLFNGIDKTDDFVYFPSKATFNGQNTEPQQGNKIYSLLDIQETFTEKPAVYQRQIKLPGKLSFRGAIELIPCNDLGYFVPDVIARNY